MAETRQTSRARLASWLAAGLLLASVAGAVSLVIAVSAGWQRDELTRNLERWISEAAGIEVSVSALEGPLYPHLTVRGLRLAAGGDPLATVEQATLEWSLGPGWPVSFEIHAVTLEGPSVSLRRAEDGTWNLPASGDGGGGSFAVWIDSLAWSEADVLVDASTADPQWSIAATSEGALRDVGLPWSRASARSVAGGFRLEFLPAVAGSLVDGGVIRAERAAGESGHIEGEIHGPAGRAKLEGYGSLPGLSDEFARVDGALWLEFEGVDASQLPGGTPVATELQGTADLVASGALLESGIPEEVDIDVEIGPSRVGAAEFDAVTLRGEIRDTWWKLFEGRAQGRGIAIDATGSGQSDRLSALALEVRLASLAELLEGWEAEGAVSGRLDASAQLSGPVGRPSGILSVHARDLTLQGIALGELVGRLGVEAGTRAEIQEMRMSGGVMELRAAPGGELRRDGEGVAVEGLALTGSGQSLTVDGWVGAEAMRDVAVQVSRADVTTWARLFSLDSEPRGIVSGMLKADGPFGDPTAHAEFEWTEASWEGSALGVLAGNATARDGRLAIDTTLTAGERETFDLEGGVAIPADVGNPDAWLRRSGDLLELRGQQVDVARIAPFLPEEVRRPRGEVDLLLKVRGGRERGVAGWLEISRGWLEVLAIHETFGPIDGRVAIGDETFRIERLSVGEAGAQAVLSGTVTLDEEMRPEGLDLGLELAGFPLERVPLPHGEDEEPSDIATGGRVDADVRLTGSVQAPRLSGRIDWKNPLWQSVVLEQVTAEVDGSMDSIEAKVRLFYEGHEIAEVRAFLPVPDQPGEPLAWLADEAAWVSIQGKDLQSALLEPFLPRLIRRPRGLADLDLRIAGGRPEPKIAGTLAFRNGSIYLPALRQTYAPIEGAARFDGEVLSIDSIQVGTPNAGARITGEIELADLLPSAVDLTAEFARFPLARSPLVRADVDGAIQLAGTLDAPILTGDLVLQDTRIQVRDADDPALKEVRIATESGPGAVRESESETNGLVDLSQIDVSLQIPRGTWIRTGMMELDVEGRGRVRKRPLRDVRVSGDLTVVRGTVKLEVRRFTVRKGIATLDGGREADPLLDVEAIYPVADVIVVAYLTGRASAPTLRLESEPPLPQDDVVAYLLFGRPADQLGGSEQGGVNAAAAGLAAGLALAELREIMGDQFPVDTVDLTIGEGDQPSRFEVGKYVGRDLFVRYGQSFGPEPQAEVGLSYRLNENWSVESTTGSEATAGADVFWSIEW